MADQLHALPSVLGVRLQQPSPLALLLQQQQQPSSGRLLSDRFAQSVHITHHADAAAFRASFAPRALATQPPLGFPRVQRESGGQPAGTYEDAAQKRLKRAGGQDIAYDIMAEAERTYKRVSR